MRSAAILRNGPSRDQYSPAQENKSGATSS